MFTTCNATFHNFSASLLSLTSDISNSQINVYSTGFFETIWNKLTSWFSWPDLATWGLIILALVLAVVVFKAICNCITATQQNVHLVALAALQSQEEGSSSQLAHAWLIRVAESPF